MEALGRTQDCIKNEWCCGNLRPNCNRTSTACFAGRTGGSTELVDPSRQSAVGSSTSRTIFFGRKSYDVTWSITASYL
jgi:hypothetical protein